MPQLQHWFESNELRQAKKAAASMDGAHVFKYVKEKRDGSKVKGIYVGEQIPRVLNTKLTTVTKIA